MPFRGVQDSQLSLSSSLALPASPLLRRWSCRAVCALPAFDFARAMASVQQIFDELAAKYKLDAKTRAWLTAADGLGAESLADFAHAAASESDLKAFVDAAGADNKFIATSRLRQAWLAVRKAEEDDAAIKRKGMDENDLDALLDQAVLDSMEDRHWARHKLSWPPEIAPADLLVSRITRELEKRLLSIKDVFKVKTQAQQLRASRKRTKVGEDLVLVSGEPDEAEAAPTLHNYLMLHLTLMLAYAKAGSKPRATAPQQEPRGGNSYEFVEVPLDLLLRYHFRLQDRAAQVKSGALAWIKHKDEADRAVWVDKYRNSTESLGQIIAATLVSREAMWEVPSQLAPPPPPAQQPDGGRQRQPNPPTRPEGGKQQPKKATIANRMRDGTKLCNAYQRGKCKAQNCQFTHKCGRVLRGGRVCGQRHPASQHDANQ